MLEDDSKPKHLAKDDEATRHQGLSPDSAQRSEMDDCPITESSPEPQSGKSPTIGPYKLLQKLGEGGMGTVWMAEQEKPVRRRVALKVIKAGLDSKQVLARFEAERQALSMMNHENIAKILDVGTSNFGQPYS